MGSEADALRELMTKAEPLFLDQHGKASNGAKVRIQTQLNQSGKLRRSIPSVTVGDEGSEESYRNQRRSGEES
jgi:hypothetical protein